MELSGQGRSQHDQAPGQDAMHQLLIVALLPNQLNQPDQPDQPDQPPALRANALAATGSKNPKSLMPPYQSHQAH